VLFANKTNLTHQLLSISPVLKINIGATKRETSEEVVGPEKDLWVK
jgi:hypothetical protein